MPEQFLHGVEVVEIDTGIAALTVAVAGASNFTEFKTAYLATLGQLGGYHDMVQISGAFLAKVMIPAMVKGLSNVIKDIETRSTSVAQALVGAAVAPLSQA